MNLIKKVKNLGKKQGGSGQTLGGSSGQSHQNQGHSLGEGNVGCLHINACLINTLIIYIRIHVYLV